MIKRSLFLWLLLCLNFQNNNVFATTKNKYHTVNQQVADGVIQVTGDLHFCIGGEVTLNAATVAGSTYQWFKDEISIPGATGISYKATVSGSYTVVQTLKKEAGSETPVIDVKYNTVAVVVSTKPTASFTENSSGTDCSNKTVTFNNTSGNGTSYEWDFGDPQSSANTSTAKNPTHTFIGIPGNGIQSFTVTLTVRNGTCTERFTKIVKTTQIPDISLGGTNSQDYQGLPYFRQCNTSASEFTFTNISTTDATNKLYKIEWGDQTANYESTTFSSSIKHTYNVGVYKLKYYITGGNECIAFKEYNVFVGNTPAGGILSPGNTSTCTSGKLNFIISGTEGNPEGTTYKITFSDGTAPLTFTHPAPATVEHTFNMSSCGYFTSNGFRNAFSASIEISNPCGTTGGTVAPIYISDRPSGRLNLSPAGSICVGNVVIANNDGTKNTVVTSTGDCTTGKSIWKISPATGWTLMNGSTLGRDNGSTDPGLWLAGSNTIYIRYDTPGNYEITMVSAGNVNCEFIDEKKQTICVNPIPVANFSLDNQQGCGPLTVKTTNLSNMPLCGTNTYQWSVVYSGSAACSPNASDYKILNGSLTSEKPEFQFINPGTYTLSLTTRNAEMGCISQRVSKDIIVKAKPVVTLTPLTAACADLPISPSARVLNCYSNTSATYSWSFPGATITSSTAQYPIDIIYPAAGTFTITLAVSNECGITTTTQTVTILPKAVGGSTTGTQTFCGGSHTGNIVLSGHTGTVQYWERSVNGTSWSTLPQSSGLTTYRYTALMATTQFRAVLQSGTCSSANSTPTTITVNPAPDKPLATIAYSYCLNETAVPLSATGTLLKWYIINSTPVNVPPAENSTFSTTAPTPSTTVAGVTTYHVTQTVNGCESAAEIITITVNPPLANNRIGSDQRICMGSIPAQLGQESGNLTGGTGIYRYQWMVSENEGVDWTAVTGAIAATYQPGILNENRAYKRIITSGSCSNESNVVKISVQGTLTNINISADQTICKNTSPLKLTGEIPMGGNGTFTYIWEKSTLSATSGFITIAGITTPDYQPEVLTQPTWYRRMVSSGSCSSLSNPVAITISPVPLTTFSIADQTICSGSNSLTVGLLSSTAGVTFNWTANPVNGITGIQTSGSGTIPAQTLINTTNSPITVVYHATATTAGNSSCPGLTATYRIVVNPIPVVTASVLQKTICSNAATGISLHSTVQGTMYSWTVSANPAISGMFNASGPVIEQVLINTSDAPQQVVYTITPAFTNLQATCSGRAIQVTITVNPTPKVQFSGQDIAICAKETSPAITLSSTTTGAVITWNTAIPVGLSGITVLSGTTSIPAQTLVNTTNHPIVLTYTASATTDDLNACPGKPFTYSITVNPTPLVTNTLLAQEVCSGEESSPVTLTSNVSSAVFRWTATATSAAITGFTTNGTGNIPTQRITNSGTTGGTVTYTITPVASTCSGPVVSYEITVSPKPLFTGIAATTAICSNTLFTYTPTSSTPGVIFNWSRAAIEGISNPATSGSGTDGAGSISETLVNTTVNAIEVTYYYTLGLGNCTSGTRYPVKVIVNPAPTALFAPFSQNGCAPFTINIKNLNSKTFPNTYTVNFGDGSQPEVFNNEEPIIHTYQNESNDAITYTLKVITKNDCGVSSSIDYLIVVQPQNIFSKLVLQGNQRYGCAPFTIDFSNLNQSAGANLFTWDFGDGSPKQQTQTINEALQHTYTTAGDFKITLTASNNCSAITSEQTITVYPPIKADFSIGQPQYCVRQAVTFSNTSDPQDAAYWDFGDGSNSTDINPTHLYASAGLKTIVLTSTKIYADGSRCFSTVTKTLNIISAPVSSFNSNAKSLNCSPFQLRVTTTPANSTNVEWDFGDPGSEGNKTTGYDASHIYTKPGTYLVTSTAYNVNGCTETTTQSIQVTETPKAAFSFPDALICGPTARVVFRNESEYSGAGFVKYVWSINDVAVPSTTADLSYTFNTPSTVLLPYIYRVKLEAINIVGCSSILEKTIQFNPLPVAAFNLPVSKACAPFKLAPVNTSTYADQFEWYVNDVLVSTEKNPSDISLAGANQTYTIKLIVNNKYGCSTSTQIKQASTYPNPKASFTLKEDLSCNGALILDVTNTSTGATTYTWDFGDGTPVSSGEKPIHTYGRPGVYQLKLTASNGFCEDTQIQRISIASPPRAAFLSDVTTGCNQLTVTFQNLSVNGISYLWDFGDGTFSTSQHPVHTYAFSAIPYHVRLTVTGDFGCTDESLQLRMISVFPPPVAKIVVSPGTTIKVPEYTFNFSAETRDDIVSYRWDFSDGRTSDKAAVSHTYAQPGIYRVFLTLTNRSGCSSTIEQVVSIEGVPGYLYIPNAFEPANNIPKVKIFSITGSGILEYSMKIFNKWGQMIWQSTKLDDQGVPTEFWDGTVNGQPAPQGVYYWNANARFINGTEWKGMAYKGKTASRTGSVHLIR